MTYTPANIAITGALKLLKSRGISHPEGELLQALRDGQLPSWGLVAVTPPVVAGRRQPPAARRRLKPAWWHHLSNPLDDTGTVYFDQRPTKPPTPFRAEDVEVPRTLIDKLWPESLDASAGAGLSAPADLVGASAPHQNQIPASKGGAKSQGILEAINEVWGGPDKIPAGLSAKERNNKITDHIRHTGGSLCKNDAAQARAIERVLKTARPN
jgi:hypothetical protein